MKYVSSEVLLERWIKDSNNIIPYYREESKFDSGLSITSKSILGVLLSKYSLLTFIDGRIRHFGGDNNNRSSLMEINAIREGRESTIPGILVIADDIAGGIFAINNGFVKNVNRGNVVFLPANALTFEDLGIGHADFVHWCLSTSSVEWLRGGWKTSDKEFKNDKEADEYILAKLAVVRDLKEIYGV